MDRTLAVVLIFVAVVVTLPLLWMLGAMSMGGMMGGSMGGMMGAMGGWGFLWMLLLVALLIVLIVLLFRGTRA